MTEIVSIHSFRGGTGKSNLTANLAALAALSGARVAVVDTDVNSPGIHVLFGLGEEHAGATLNDYLFGRCGIQDATYEVPLADTGHSLRVIPSRLSTGAITQVLREGYDVERLNEGFLAAGRELGLDLLFIDTHPGLNEETLLSIAISDTLLIVLRPDEQDYLGTSVTVEVARRLSVPELFLVVNKAYRGLDPERVRADVGAAYGAEVIGVLPHSDNLMQYSSRGVFALAFPDDPLTATFRSIAERVAGS